jgi:membrane fusion protein, adhesin transport system
MSTTFTNLSAQISRDLERPSFTIWLCTFSVWGFILWASYAWLDEIVRGEGQIVSSSRPQIIQNLEGGILSELPVKEGEEVQGGDVLARLYGTQFQSAVDDLQNQIATLEIRRLRLEAELAGESAFQAPSSLAARLPEMLASEQALLVARRVNFTQRRESARVVLEQAASEKKLMENLIDEKVVALIEVTRARKAHADAQKAYDEIVSQTQLEQAQEYSNTLKELATLRQNLKASQDQLNRTVLVAPMRGVVTNLRITTIGGVVRPGEEIMQIIPVGEELLVEAQVAPKDIANIRPGQEATIKVSAYDYTIFGTLKGRVVVISADTFKDEQDPRAEPHYKVLVRVDMAGISDRQAAIAIRPGMLATVELHTGKKTVLQYLLKPLTKSREALREP